MPGAADPDPLYIAARSTLLDALAALGPHRHSTVLVGAQAIYCHTGAADIAIAEFTTDGDLALDPRTLGSTPLIEQALQTAGFRPGKQPGIWVSRHDVTVDLLVPESLGGGGRRSARVPPHGRSVARKVHGLEAALVDNRPIELQALDPTDGRSTTVNVAGPAALLISKCHKIAERVEHRSRIKDKDALDVLRLLRTADLEVTAATLQGLTNDPMAGSVSAAAIAHMFRLFATADGPGSQMAARAATPMEPAETTAQSCAALCQDLLDLIERG